MLKWLVSGRYISPRGADFLVSSFNWWQSHLRRFWCFCPRRKARRKPSNPTSLRKSWACKKEKNMALVFELLLTLLLVLARCSPSQTHHLSKPPFPLSLTSFYCPLCCLLREVLPSIRLSIMLCPPTLLSYVFLSTLDFYSIYHPSPSFTSIVCATVSQDLDWCLHMLDTQ